MCKSNISLYLDKKIVVKNHICHIISHKRNSILKLLLLLLTIFQSIKKKVYETSSLFFSSMKLVE